MCKNCSTAKLIEDYSNDIDIASKLQERMWRIIQLGKESKESRGFIHMKNNIGNGKVPRLPTTHLTFRV